MYVYAHKNENIMILLKVIIIISDPTFAEFFFGESALRSIRLNYLQQAENICALI